MGPPWLTQLFVATEQGWIKWRDIKGLGVEAMGIKEGS